jgi:hypothetical protein
MGYEVEVIDRDTCDAYRRKYDDDSLFSAKADIGGVCVQLYTADRDHMEMWTDNFYAMSDHTRSHARLFCVTEPGAEMKVFFEPYTNTAFLINFDYYGWVKSIGLGIAGNILEESHGTFSIHGAALDIDGTGVTLIAPSKTGKTTQSWGLLRAENAHLISDDWYFVRLGKGRPAIYGSEKNCYIDADIGDVWEEYKPLVKNVKFDNKGRGIANVRWVAGEQSVINSTSMKHIIFLKRDPADKCVSRELTADEALEYMSEHDLCNPHQIVRSERKMRIRMEFLKQYFSSCSLHMINTVKSPAETQDLIREIVLKCDINAD